MLVMSMALVGIMQMSTTPMMDATCKDSPSRWNRGKTKGMNTVGSSAASTRDTVTPHQHGDQQQAAGQGVDLLFIRALADALAHHDGGGSRHAEAGYGGELLDVAHDGIGRQHLGADGHVAHDGGHDTDAQAPQRLVHQNGSGVSGEIPPDGAAGPQDGGGQQGHMAAAQGAYQSNEELHDAGGQCSHWPPR